MRRSLESLPAQNIVWFYDSIEREITVTQKNLVAQTSNRSEQDAVICLSWHLCQNSHKDALHQKPDARLWCHTASHWESYGISYPPKPLENQPATQGPITESFQSIQLKYRLLCPSCGTWCVKLMSGLLWSMMALFSPWDCRHWAWIDLWLPWDAVWSRSYVQAVLSWQGTAHLLLWMWKGSNKKIQTRSAFFCTFRDG